MHDESLISVNELCTHHQVEMHFFELLQSNGLFEFTTVEQQIFVPSSQLNELEKMIHLHYDLDVNIEGIDVIRHMLSRLEEAQREINQLHNRLRFYERGGE